MHGVFDTESSLRLLQLTMEFLLFSQRKRENGGKLRQKSNYSQLCKISLLFLLEMYNPLLHGSNFFIQLSCTFSLSLLCPSYTGQ